LAGWYADRPLAPSKRLAKLLLAICWVVASFAFLAGVRASEDESPTPEELPPMIFEWYPFEPVTLAVNDVRVLFGDVDDFGGGVYTCTWQSDRRWIATQTVELAGSDWVQFKSKITFKPSSRDVGTRTITLTVQDPDGHTDVRTYVVNVIRPRGPKR
jgi:hypothetical protein